MEWIVSNVRGGKTGLVEKPRDAGLTFIFALVWIYFWLFTPNFVGGVSSIKAENVDQKGNPKSIFWKLRFILRRLPPWLIPQGFSWSRHSNHMRLYNPTLDSSIIGEVGKSMGRAGRYSAYFADEWAHVDDAKTKRTAISEATESIFLVSTVAGIGNDFYDQRHALPLEQVFIFDWRDDLRKDDAWYAKKREQYKADPEIIAQEIDRDYQAATTGQFIPPEWIRAALDFDIGEEEGDRVSGLDVADTGKAQNVLIDRDGGRITGCQAWSGIDTTQTTGRAIQHCEESGIYRLIYDAIGTGAGVRGASNASETETEVIPFFAGVPPIQIEFDDDPDGIAKRRFLNIKAQAWWIVRMRFRKTWQNHLAVQNEKPLPWPLEECISIPLDLPYQRQLTAELGIPLMLYTATGKVRVESKDELKRRGIRSPDFAEAFVLSFADQLVQTEVAGSMIAWR